MKPLSDAGYRGGFGGLRNNLAKAIEDPSTLLESANTMHQTDGAIEKRFGYGLHGEIASYTEPVTPMHASALSGGGNLRPEVTYYLRHTFVTAAGETDDWHSGDAAGPEEKVVTLGASDDAISASIPMHLRGVTISAFEVLSDTSVRFQIDQPVVTMASPSDLVGWLVYSRSPIIQDETHLGFNCSAAEPLYNRRQDRPNGLLGKVSAFDGTWFTMDRKAKFGDSGVPDQDTLDIMMPDRNGLPVRYANIYISTDRINFYWTQIATTGTAAVLVVDHDETATRAPSTRVPRAEPTVTAIDAAEEKQGLCGEWVTDTKLEAGMYKVRYTWVFDDPDVMRPPGLQEAQAALGEMKYCYPWRACQEAWPSCAEWVSINEGQGFSVVPPTFPDGYLQWKVYVEKVVPDETLDFTDATKDPDQASGGDPSIHGGAWTSHDNDLSIVDANAYVAASIDDPPEDKRNQLDGYDQFNDIPAIMQNSDDPNDPDTRGWPPSFKDLYDHYTGSIGFDLDDGIERFYYSSTRPADANNAIPTQSQHFWMPIDDPGSPSDYTHWTLKFRLRAHASSTASSAWRPSAKDGYRIRIWNETSQAWEVLGGLMFQGDDWKHYGYSGAMDYDYVMQFATHDGGNRRFLIFEIVADSYNGFSLDTFDLELYDVGACCGEKTAEVNFQPDNGWRRQQSFGSSWPEGVGAYYSGDNDLIDSDVNAYQTTGIGLGYFGENMDPDDNPRDTRLAEGVTYDEYDNQTTFYDYSKIGYSRTVAAGQINLIISDAQAYSSVTLKVGAVTLVNGVDWDWNLANGNHHGTNGTIDILTYPDGTVISVTMDRILYQSVLIDPTLAASRGFKPAYDSIAYPATKYYYSPDDNGPLDYASSRDGTDESIEWNHHHWWFEVPSLPECTRDLVVEIRFRARAGGAGWSSSTDTNRKVRLWKEDESAWDVLESGIDSTTYSDFTTRRYCIENYDAAWAYSLTTTASDPYGPGPRNYIIVDFIAGDHSGFDIEYVRVEWRARQDDPRVNEHELLVDTITHGTETWDVDRPIPIKPRVCYTAAGWTSTDMIIRQGEFCPIRPNTTGQWPCSIEAMPIVMGAGNSTERRELYVSCADSVFVDTGYGALERVYQQEGTYHPKSCVHDWRFTNYLSRVFFCNPGVPTGNFRFDGVQTWKMGLAWPFSPVDEEDGRTDELGNYVPPGDNEFEQDLNSDDDVACNSVGEQAIVAAGEIVVTEPPVGCAEPYGDDNQPVVCHDVEYRFSTMRILPTENRSYILWSRPRLLTETVEVAIHEDFDTTVSFTTEICPEAQATHIAVYRNEQNTATYFTVGIFKIDKGTINEATGKVKISISDIVPPFGSDLGLPMYLETGRPRAARLMKYHHGRVWMVPQGQGEVIDITNINSPQGSYDPEGWWPLNVVDPPMNDSAEITCLAPYNDVLTAHSRQGIVALQGLSEDINDPSAIGAQALAAHTGFIGHAAWQLVDNRLVGMTDEGPGTVLGAELEIFATDDVDFDNYNFTLEDGVHVRIAYYRTRGVEQLIFTAAKNPFGRYEDMLVLESTGKQASMKWKEWEEMPASGLTIGRDTCGEEHPLMADCRGRIFQFGEGYWTDCGVFIPCDFQTQWFDMGGKGRANQPRMNYWEMDGDVDDFFMVDVYKDGERNRFNSRDIRVWGGSRTAVAPGCGNERLLMTDDYRFDYPGDVWPDDDKDFDKQRTNHRGWFDRISYRISQTRDKLPIGVHPASRFILHGALFFHRTGGPREANAGG